MDDRSRPRYWAVSYTWGDKYPLYVISINGQRFQVRRNLFTLLSAIRHGAPCNLGEATTSKFQLDQIYLWVDQICINQDSNVERNHQVGLMRTIYERGDFTVVWLGPKHELPGSNYILNSIMIDEDELPRTDDFFDHPYWDRLWVVQEIMYSREVLVMCGLSGVFWNDFAAYYANVGGLFKTRHDTNSVYRGNIASLVRVRQMLKSDLSWDEKRARDTMISNQMLASQVDRLTLRQAIETFADRQCQDVRDKVFGLQGLVEPRHRFPIDYSLTVSELFFAVMEKILEDDPLDFRATIDDFAKPLMQILGVADSERARYLWVAIVPLRKKQGLMRLDLD